jgi:hypothetical protein
MRYKCKFYDLNVRVTIKNAYKVWYGPYEISSAILLNESDT